MKGEGGEELVCGEARTTPRPDVHERQLGAKPTNPRCWWHCRQLRGAAAGAPWADTLWHCCSARRAGCHGWWGGRGGYWCVPLSTGSSLLPRRTSTPRH